jgi:hypothetical protein
MKKMQESISVVTDFKGANLKQKLNALRAEMIGGTKNSVPNIGEVYESALIFKSLSAQIDEVVHSTGIIKLLPRILDENEKILGLSLAAGADGDGIDLVTNKRIAEFKFSRWQTGVANGMRKRQVFTDLVNLYLDNRKLTKELYVLDYEMVLHYLEKSRAQWINVLSKSKTAHNDLSLHVKEQKLSCETVADVYKLSGVTVRNIEELIL